jgi:hypothetical protein
MSSFNLFGPATKCDIRVGYIDPDNGYIADLSIHEANKYAKLNPGSVFILKNRDVIKYLNINEVNRLTPDDLEPDSARKCDGVIGLDIYDDDGNIKPEALELKDPKVVFSGGGGIGAKGNPIFGQDGSLLAVDLINGGWGYQYAPITEVIDPNGIAAGAVVRSVMVGDPEYPECKFIRTVEVYDQEEDFEEYDLDTCSPNQSNYGRRYDPDGNDIGAWDPTLYATLKSDPIRIEIQKYQDYLQSLIGGFKIDIGSNTIRNWWTTRKEVPLSVTSSTKSDRSIHNVSDTRWNDFMNAHAVSPVPPSNVIGSDFAGILYTLEWEEDFPYKGDYTFRGLCDNKAVLYLDNNKIGDLKSFSNSPDAIKKNIEVGVHKIRVDLENIPAYKKVIEPDKTNFVNTTFTVYGSGSERHRQISFSFTAEDGSHSFVLRNVQTTNTSYSKVISVKRNVDYRVVSISDNAPKSSDTKSVDFPIKYGSDASSTSGKRVVNKGREIEFDDDANDGFDVNATLKILSTSPGVTAKFAEDGSKLILKGDASGDVTIEFDWNDNPSTSGLSVGSLTIGETEFTQSGEKGSQKKKIKLNSIDNSNSDAKILEQGILDVGFAKVNKSKEGGSEPGNTIFADFVKSDNDDDDMQVRTSEGLFTPSNKRKIYDGDSDRNTWDLIFKTDASTSTKQGQSSVGLQKSKEVFNSVNFIEKAARKLWRINPILGANADFFNRYGVVPFDPNGQEAKSDEFSGKHIILWDHIDFPYDGNYNIVCMSDDSAKLYIGNRDGGGRIGIGNGLKDISDGGDEVIIDNRGSKSSITKFFRAGLYRIRVELNQISGKTLAKGNPMGIALKINTTFSEKNIISGRSFNQNPMGVSISIDAPMPSIPQEPKPISEGRCPNNPIWSTRFPGASDKWYPVIFDNRWSEFMNRYAISPVPPLSSLDSDAGGIIYRNSWVIDAPYAGFYGLKGTVDNGGKISVNGITIISGGVNYEQDGLKGFNVKYPETKKFFLDKGQHTIDIEVLNEETDTYKIIEQKIFDTSDWISKQTPPALCEVEIIYYGLHPRNKKLKVSSDKKRIDFIDDDGNDVNASFIIKSGDAVFSDDGKKLIGKTATLEFKYDDNPFDHGEAINSISIGKINWGKKQSPGSRYKSAKEAYDDGDIRGLSDFSKDIITETRWKYDKSLLVAPGLYKQAKGKFDRVSDSGTSYWQVDKDDDEQGFVPLGRPNIDESGAVKKVVDICAESGSGKVSESKNKSPVINGVRYSGPEIASYIEGSISPVFQNLETDTEEIQGKTWIMTWENVNFPRDGRYTVSVSADDQVILRVDGNEIITAKYRSPEVSEGGRTVRKYRSPEIFDFSVSKGKRTVQLELSNIRIPNTGFKENPVYTSVKITKKRSISTGISLPWTTNPIGISAILIPPPCPKEVTGKGKVCRVVVSEPGNGWPNPTVNVNPNVTTVYPVVLVLVGVEVEDGGIKYNCGVDQLVIEPSNGVELAYSCDTFGTITGVSIVGGGGGTGGDGGTGDAGPGGGDPGPGGAGLRVPVGQGFSKTPNIRMITDTGINARFRPIFDIVRDPINVDDIDPDNIIQVTDLVGLKQTGYVNGRAYYGSVYYKNNVRYAGIYETAGQPIQVYDTLQESINAEVTTRPSAILRQGTDVRDDNPRLNIPGTPDTIN